MITIYMKPLTYLGCPTNHTLHQRYPPILTSHKKNKQNTLMLVIFSHPSFHLNKTRRINNTTVQYHPIRPIMSSTLQYRASNFLIIRGRRDRILITDTNLG